MVSLRLKTIMIINLHYNGGFSTNLPWGSSNLLMNLYHHQCEPCSTTDCGTVSRLLISAKVRRPRMRKHYANRVCGETVNNQHASHRHYRSLLLRSRNGDKAQQRNVAIGRRRFQFMKDITFAWPPLLVVEWDKVGGRLNEH